MVWRILFWIEWKFFCYLLFIKNPLLTLIAVDCFDFRIWLLRFLWILLVLCLLRFLCPCMNGCTDYDEVLCLLSKLETWVNNMFTKYVFLNSNSSQCIRIRFWDKWQSESHHKVLSQLVVFCKISKIFGKSLIRGLIWHFKSAISKNGNFDIFFATFPVAPFSNPEQKSTFNAVATGYLYHTNMHNTFTLESSLNNQNHKQKNR